MEHFLWNEHCSRYFHMCYLSWKVKVLVAQWCQTLCNPMNCTLPGSIFFSRGSSGLRDQTQVYCITGRFFAIYPNPSIEPRSLLSAALAGRFFTTSSTWEVLSFNVSTHNSVPNQSTETTSKESQGQRPCGWCNNHHDDKCFNHDNEHHSPA